MSLLRIISETVERSVKFNKFISLSKWSIVKYTPKGGISLLYRFTFTLPIIIE